MYVPRCLGHLQARAIILLCIIPQPLVGAEHAEVVIRDGAPALIATLTERLERAPVVIHRRREIAVNVRHDPEILLDAPHELLALGAKLEGATQALARLRPFTTLDVHERDAVECLGGEQSIVARHRDLVAPLTERDCLVVFVPAAPDDTKPAQRLGEYRPVDPRVGVIDRRLVALDRFDDPARALVLARLTKKDDGAPGPNEPRRRKRREWTNTRRHAQVSQPACTARSDRRARSPCASARWSASAELPGSRACR